MAPLGQVGVSNYQGIWLRAVAPVIVSALARGLSIECGCFGTIGGKHIGLVNLAIDSTLFFLAALIGQMIQELPGERSLQGGRRAELRATPQQKAE